MGENEFTICFVTYSLPLKYADYGSCVGDSDRLVV